MNWFLFLVWASKVSSFLCGGQNCLGFSVWAENGMFLVWDRLTWFFVWLV